MTVAVNTARERKYSTGLGRCPWGFEDLRYCLGLEHLNGTSARPRGCSVLESRFLYRANATKAGRITHPPGTARPERLEVELGELLGGEHLAQGEHKGNPPL